MRLTLYTDHGLRVLMFLGARGGAPATVSEIAECYGISRNHLVKVVHGLGQQGFVLTQRGKGGGILLARAPSEIRIGDVVRQMEESLALVECMGSAPSRCRLSQACALTGVLSEAREAFLETLDHYTPADLLVPDLPRLLGFVQKPRRLAGSGR